MRDPKLYYIYMLTSSTRRAIYTGVTNSLIQRILNHRAGKSTFTAKYKTYRLVHYETFVDIRNAIAREKEIKTWTRAKKDSLILLNNPSWQDLATNFDLEEWPPKSPPA